MTTETKTKERLIDLHSYEMKAGKHRGVRIVNVPVSYLLWMVGVNHSESLIAKAELDRRGTVVPDVEISGHAIDRASLLCRKTWHQDKGENEGIHAWLVRVAGEALRIGERRNNGKIYWKGMKFKFTADTKWPVLLTILPSGRVTP